MFRTWGQLFALHPGYPPSNRGKNIAFNDLKCCVPVQFLLWKCVFPRKHNVNAWKLALKEPKHSILVALNAIFFTCASCTLPELEYQTKLLTHFEFISILCSLGEFHNKVCWVSYLTGINNRNWSADVEWMLFFGSPGFNAIIQRGSQPYSDIGAPP